MKKMLKKSAAAKKFKKNAAQYHAAMANRVLRVQTSNEKKDSLSGLFKSDTLTTKQKPVLITTPYLA